MPPEGRDERTLLEGLTATPEGDDRFVAVAPEGFGPQAFGGVVVAHAVNAALQTVDAPSTLHSLHGYFLRPVAVEEPVQIDVARTRDGRSFTPERWSTPVHGYARHDGRRLPSAASALWHPEEGEPFVYAEMTLVDVAELAAPGS